MMTLEDGYSQFFPMERDWREGTKKMSKEACEKMSKAKMGNTNGAKITQKQHDEMVKLYTDGWLQREIAEKFGVTGACVSLQIRNKVGVKKS